MKKRGTSLRGVRLDSGDMVVLSQQVRKILDEAGLQEVEIFASGNFDEFKIADHIERGCVINAFGVGTRMGVSADAPYCDMAYKLVEYKGRPVLKLSSGKKTLVCQKQVFRVTRDNHLVEDFIGLKDEKLAGEPMLQTVMRNGRRLHSPEPLDLIQERFRLELAQLGDRFKVISAPDEYPVLLGKALQELQTEVTRQTIQKELN